MTEKSWRLFAVIAAAGLLSGLLKWQYAAGWTLGCAVSVLTYKILEHYCDMAIRLRSSAGTMGHFMINFMIWAAVLTFCAFFGDWVNIIACAAGLTAVKMAIILHTALNRE